MKRTITSGIQVILLSLIIVISMVPAGVFALDEAKAGGTVAPTAMWLNASETANIPARIDLFKVKSGTSYIYQLFLLADKFLMQKK